MFELPEDLKKISAGKINEVKQPPTATATNHQATEVDPHRGRTEQKEDDEASILDKAAKRAAKKRR